MMSKSDTHGDDKNEKARISQRTIVLFVFTLHVYITYNYVYDFILILSTYSYSWKTIKYFIPWDILMSLSQELPF